MIDHMTGLLARSRAGHDKDNLFIIIEEDDTYVYLVDGKTRTLDRPKRKKKKHVQVMQKREESLCKNLTQGIPVTDAQVRRFIACCKREGQL